MAISAEDQKDIDQLRHVAPLLAEIAATMAEKKGQDPALDAAGRKFAALAKAPDPLSQVMVGFQLRAINTQLENPDTRKAVESLLERNPAGFEKVLPQIFADPKETARLIQKQLAALPPPAAPVRPAREDSAPAPKIISPKTTAPAPQTGGAPILEAAVSAIIPSAHAATESSPVPKTAAPETGGMVGFMDFLLRQKEKNPEIIKDFAIFQAKIDSNQVPAVSDAYRALTAGTKSSAESNATLNELKKTIESQPQFFANLNKTMDEKPGIAAKIVSGFSDPKTGLGALSTYSNFANGGIGKMLNSLFEMVMGPGGFDKLISGFLNLKSSLFKDSSAAGQIIQGNGQMAAQANKATGAAPGQVTLQDAAGNKTEMSAQQLAQRAEGPQKIMPSLDPTQKVLQEQPGMRPGAAV